MSMDVVCFSWLFFIEWDEIEYDFKLCNVELVENIIVLEISVIKGESFF